MARTKAFNEEEVLDKAVQVFWAKGYEATSMADLCDCTGLHKGSLYQSFGDKHELFMRALQHYSDKEFRETMAVVKSSASPLQNIRSIMHKVCEGADECKGCLVINSMVELAPHNEDVKAAVNSFGEKRLHFMTEMIGEAQKAGEIRAELQPEKLATQLMVTMAGLAATSKSFMGSKDGISVLDHTIDLWT